MLEAMNVRDYLDGCHTRAVFEAAHLTTPPSGVQTDELFAYLRKFKLNPVVVGSAALVHHMGDDIGGQKASDVRPTLDLDVYVSGPLPEPPPGWKRCTRSPGVSRWISPSGGVVDFLQGGHAFPDGAKAQKFGTVDVVLPGGVDYKVADQTGVWKYKLNTVRTKDLTDLALLGKARGVPSDKELGRLSADQRENLEHVRLLVSHSTMAELIAMSKEARQAAEE